MQIIYIQQFFLCIWVFSCKFSHLCLHFINDVLFFALLHNHVFNPFDNCNSLIHKYIYNIRVFYYWGTTYVEFEPNSTESSGRVLAVIYLLYSLCLQEFFNLWIIIFPYNCWFDHLRYACAVKIVRNFAGLLI